MSEIEKFMAQGLTDGRQIGVFKAACEANHKGIPQDEAINQLVEKASKIDGLDEGIARKKVEEAYRQYPNEHGTRRTGIRAVVTESIDSKIIELDWTPVAVTEPMTSSREQLLEYIKAVFKPNDYIALCTKPVFDSDKKKYSPRTNILTSYERVTNEIQKEDTDIFSIDQDIPGGAYVMVNPVNGFPGEKSQEDIMDHRHCLVECDHLPIDQQMAVLSALQLPIVALTHSGRRSLHAVVHIGAGKNWKLYKKRAAFLFSVLDMALVRADEGCKNPNRWTRISGFNRKEETGPVSKQYLIGTHLGDASFEEWETSMIEKMNSIPPPTDFSQMIERPLLPSEVIKGILRYRGRFLLGGASKKGKSMMLIQMALAISSGTKWLGFDCKKSKVMYVDLELGKGECDCRFLDVGETMNIARSEFPLAQNIDPSDATLDSVAKTVIYRCKQYGVEVVIIDPVYSLIGNEIDPQEVKKLVRMINIIISSTGAAVIYCHHNNKGNANSSQHNHIDRISGSSVFGRSPDALMTYSLDSNDKGKAFFTLRGFKQPDPLQLRFEYPIFHIENQTRTAPGASNGVTVVTHKGRKPLVNKEEVNTFLIENPEVTAKVLMSQFHISMSLAYELKEAFEKEHSEQDDNAIF